MSRGVSERVTKAGAVVCRPGFAAESPVIFNSRRSAPGAKGPIATFRTAKNSELFRCRHPPLKSVTEVQFEACYRAHLAEGVIPLGTGQMAIGIGRRQL